MRFKDTIYQREREILGLSRLAIWQRVFTMRLLAMSGDIFGKQFGSGGELLLT